MNSRTSSSGNGSALAISKAQIVFLLSTLDESSYARHEREIYQLIEAHGAEANIHLIKRLVVSAYAASGPPTSTSGQQHLAMRLLISFTRRLTDPLLTSRFREAIQSGLNDTSSGSASSEAFKALGEHLPAFCDRAGFNGIEKLILGLEMVRVMIIPAIAANSNTPSARSALALHSKLKECGLSALALVTDCWSLGVDSLASGQSSDLLGPVAFSRLLDRIASDWRVDPEKGEMFVGENTTTSVTLLDDEKVRLFVAAMTSRVGQQTAMQIIMHSLENMQFAPNTNIISILHRLLPDSTSCTPEIIKSVLQRHAQLPSPPQSVASEERISLIMQELIKLSARSPKHGIDIGMLIRALNDHFPPGSSWKDVILLTYDSNSDQPLPEIWGLDALNHIMASPISHASTALWAKWQFPAKQLALIERLVFLNQDRISIAPFPNSGQIISPSDLTGASSTIRTIAQTAANSPWNSSELIITLVKLSEYESLRSTVADIFERASKTDPEVILTGLLMIPRPWNALHSSLCARLLSNFLSGSPGHQLVFHRIWQLDQGFLLAAMRDFYAESELNIGRIVDISQDLHILQDVLDLRPFRLALDAAALASRREFLELARWLTTTISRYGALFVKECLAFVGSKIRYELSRNEADPAPEATTMPLVAGAVAIFIKALRISHELFTADDVEAFKEVRTLSLQLHPRLLNFAPGGDQEPGMTVATFPADVEAEVDATFKRMYEAEITVDEVVRILQRSRDSGDPRRIEFYQCMLHGLMDEMRFVATYPPQELLLTAYLFGSLIRHQVVDHIPLGIAVRYVLDALKHPPSSASYRFGVNALSRFQMRLQEWPQLASAILSIPHFSSASPEIANYAQIVLSDPSSSELALPNGATDVDTLENSLPVAFTAIMGSSSDTIDLALPEESVTEKILFIVNNLAPSNLEGKVSEMSSKLQDGAIHWFANYLVNQRVCMEPNNHGLYLDFLDGLARPQLLRHVLEESYVKSATLLNSEKTVSSSTERTLLKNLGAWIGALTLARNKPIKHANIAFKELLIEGYDSNRLIAAIPFVCKILEQASKSRIFKPPNPWLLAVLRLLVELYQFADLKLNLKFEIEVLCKSLNVDLKDVEPTQMLRQRPEKQEATSSHSKSNVTASENTRPASRSQQSIVLTGQAGFAIGLQDIINAKLQSLPASTIFNPSLAVLLANPNLKRAILASLDRAIRDIIAPVVERSVTIAGISTRELITKDFAMEGDEAALRKAAHLMAQNLAGSLALVTCKEPLRISIMSNLRTFFVQAGYAEHNLPEQAINVITNDNLDVACTVVERVAMDKAILEIDESLSSAYTNRKKHRECSTTAFWDASATNATHFANLLPDPLRLKPAGLLPDQLLIYDDFSRLRSHVGLLDDTSAHLDPLVDGDDSARQSEAQVAGGPLLLTVQQAVDKFNHIIGELDAALANETTSSAAQLPAGSDILLVLGQLPMLAAHSLHTDETALACAQKVVQLLYKAHSELAREVYAILLERLCSLSEKVVREVIAWLIYAEDERKFSVPVILVLIRHHIIPLAEYESQLAKLVIRDFKPSTIDFVSEFARAVLAADPPLALKEQLPHLTDALAQVVQQDKATDGSIALMRDLRMGHSVLPINRAEIEAQEIKEQLTVFFVQWVRIFQTSTELEASFVEYVVQLQEHHGILKGEDLSARFFRTCTEVSIDTYIKQKANGGTIASGIFQPVDALGALIAFMLKYHGDGTSHKSASDAKAFYLTKVLSIIVLVLAQAHEEMGVHFAVAQKPFFRLFSSLLSNLHQAESHLGSAYPKILISLSHSINTLQPIYFPGFTFSWIALLSHRLLMPKLLRDRDGQVAFLRLLTSLVRFLDPHMQGTLSESIRSLYAATCKIFLVLLHDFPEFLAAYHIGLCDMIPPGCIQLQNIVLSAFPSHVRLADPFSPDALHQSDFKKTPVIYTDYLAPLAQSPALASTMEAILQEGQSPKSIVGVLQHLRMPSAPGSQSYIRKLVSAFCMVILTSGIAHLTKGIEHFDEDTASVQLFKHAVAGLDAEGRYSLISSLANQLRFPSTHTEYASRLYLSLFGAKEDSLTKEIALRIILERICSHRPHPFGLVLTQVELLNRFSLDGEDFMQRVELQALVPLLQQMQKQITGIRAMPD